MAAVRVTLEILGPAGDYAPASARALPGSPGVQRDVWVAPLGVVSTVASGEQFRLRLRNQRAERTGVFLEVDGVNVYSTGSWALLGAHEELVVAGYKNEADGRVEPFRVRAVEVDEGGGGGGGLRARALDVAGSAGTVSWRAYGVTEGGAVTVTRTNLAPARAAVPSGKAALLVGVAAAPPAFAAATWTERWESSVTLTALVDEGKLFYRDRSAVLLLLGDAHARAAAAAAGAAAATPRAKMTRAARAAAFEVEDESDGGGGGGGGGGGTRGGKKARRAAIVADGATCPFTMQPLADADGIVVLTCGHGLSRAGWASVQKPGNKWASTCTLCRKEGVAVRETL